MKYYRLLTQLPALPDTPGRPPVSLDEAIDVFQEDLAEKDWELAEEILRWLDCENLESKIQGREIFNEKAPLSREQLDDRRELPVFMADFLDLEESGALSGPYAVDELWRYYHLHLLEISRTHGCSMLGEWAFWEAGLRNAFARSRAQEMGVDLEGRLFEESEDEMMYSEMVVWASEASDPLEKERLIDQNRLAKLNELAGINPFSREAALCYLLSLIILDRWDLPVEVDTKQLLEVFS